MPKWCKFHIEIHNFSSKFYFFFARNFKNNFVLGLGLRRSWQVMVARKRSAMVSLFCVDIPFFTLRSWKKIDEQNWKHFGYKTVKTVCKFDKNDRNAMILIFKYWIWFDIKVEFDKIDRNKIDQILTFQLFFCSEISNYPKFKNIELGYLVWITWSIGMPYLSPFLIKNLVGQKYICIIQIKFVFNLIGSAPICLIQLSFWLFSVQFNSKTIKFRPKNYRF